MARPTITDHALVRYLQRTGRLDVEALRADMGAKIERAIMAGGSIGQRFDILIGGMRWIVADGRVVTVIAEDTVPKRRRRRPYSIPRGEITP